MRTTLFTLLIITGIFAGMLFLQWSDYFGKDDKTSTQLNIEQEIKVKHVNHSLQIVHNFHRINKNKQFKVVVPKNSKGPKCLKDEPIDCKKGKGKNTFISETGTLSITYTVQIPENKQAYLFDNWFALIENSNVTSTITEIIETNKTKGSWAAGASLIGRESLNHIDFYVFKGKGGAFPLFWQSAPLNYYSDDESVGIFIEDIKKLQSFPLNLKYNNNGKELEKRIIVLTNLHPKYQTSTLYITSKLDIEEIKRWVIIEQFKIEHPLLANKEHWLIELFLPYLSNLKIEHPKTREIMAEMTRNLSESQIDQFMRIALSKQHKLSVKGLDHALEEVVGKPTQFFSNASKKSSIVQMIFYDNRPVIINGQNYPNINVAIYKERLYLPFYEIMKALGFKVDLMDNEIVNIKKGNHSVRFYLNKSNFTVNGVEYGLLEKPLIRLNNGVYMEKHLLVELFKIKLVENKGEVSLHSTF